MTAIKPVGFVTGPPVEEVSDRPLHHSISLMPPRDLIFAGLFLIGFLNGNIIRAADLIADVGFVNAILMTFNISAIVWIGCYFAVSYATQGPHVTASRRDLVIAAIVTGICLLPMPPISWIAVTLLAVYIILTTRAQSALQRAGCLMLAITVPMFWSRMTFAFLSDFFLSVDASLVGWMIGAQRAGNVIQLPDGSGYLWIAPGCSSLANVSLAILCWVVFSQTCGRRGFREPLGWCVLACASVVAINIVRMGLIGLFPEHYDLLHGVVGQSVSNWLIVGVSTGVCAFAMHRGHQAERA